MDIRDFLEFNWLELKIVVDDELVVEGCHQDDQEKTDL